MGLIYTLFFKTSASRELNTESDSSQTNYLHHTSVLTLLNCRLYLVLNVSSQVYIIQHICKCLSSIVHKNA